MKKILIFLFPFLCLNFVFAEQKPCTDDMYDSCNSKAALKLKNRLTSPTLGVKLDPEKMDSTLDEQLNKLNKSENDKERKALKRQKKELEKEAGRIADVVEDEVKKRVEKIEDKLEDKHNETEEELEEAYKKKKAKLERSKKEHEKEEDKLEKDEEEFEAYKKKQLLELKRKKAAFDEYVVSQQASLETLADKINQDVALSAKKQSLQREIFFATEISVIMQSILRNSPYSLRKSGENLPDYSYTVAQSFGKLTKTIDTWISENPVLVSLEFLTLIYFTYQTGKGFVTYLSYVLYPGKKHAITKKKVTSDALDVRKIRNVGFFGRLKNVIHPGRLFGFILPFLGSAAVGSHLVDHILLNAEKRNSLRKTNTQFTQDVRSSLSGAQKTDSSSFKPDVSPVTVQVAPAKKNPKDQTSEEEIEEIDDLLAD